MRAIRTTIISILAIGLLAGSGPRVAAHDESPFAPWTGRVEDPEAGYTITFPDGWFAQELTEALYWALYTERLADDWTPYLWAVRRGSWPQTTCALYDMSDFALKPPAFSSVEDAARDQAADADEVRTYEFEVGPVARLSGTAHGAGGNFETYYFQRGDQWAMLSCFAPEPDEDPWKIARSFEFLPAE